MTKAINIFQTENDATAVLFLVSNIVQHKSNSVVETLGEGVKCAQS